MMDSPASHCGESTSKTDGKWHGNSVYIGLVMRTCEEAMTLVVLHSGFPILLKIPGQRTRTFTFQEVSCRLCLWWLLQYQEEEPGVSKNQAPFW